LMAFWDYLFEAGMGEFGLLTAKLTSNCPRLALSD
jgi:hypothetical protein